MDGGAVQDGAMRGWRGKGLIDDMEWEMEEEEEDTRQS